jgi:TonB family protein
MLRSLLVLSAMIGLGIPAPASAAAPPAHAATIESLRLMQVRGEVVIGVDGGVVSAELNTERIEPELRNSLMQTIRAWRFDPIRILGQPAQVKTAFRLSLAARPDGDKFKVRIDGVDFGDRSNTAAVLPDGAKAPIRAKLLSPPQYPKDLAFRGIGGSVLVAILVGPDGRTERAQVVQSLVHDFGKLRGDKPAQRALKTLESSALAAVKHWTYEVPPERAAAPPEDRTVVTTVVFMIDYDVNQPGYWVPVQRGERRPTEWLPPERSQGLALGASGSAAPVDIASPFRMTSPLGATTLD